MQLEFRSLVLNLTPQQIIPTAIRYRIVKGSEQRDGSDLSDHILSVYIYSYDTFFILFLEKIQS